MRPLERATVYSASATLQVAGASGSSAVRTLARTWTFKTELIVPETSIEVIGTQVQFMLGTPIPSVTQGRIAARTLSPAPIAITVVSNGRTVAQRAMTNGEVWDTGLPPGEYSLCGQQAGTDRFLAANDVCSTMLVRDPASYVHRTTISFTGNLRGRKLTYATSVDPAIRRRVTVTAQRGTKSCFKAGAAARCHWATFRTVARLAGVSQQRYITARSSDRGIRIIVTVPEVRLGDELYESARFVGTLRRT